MSDTKSIGKATPRPWAYYDNGFDGGIVSGWRPGPPHRCFEKGGTYDVMICGGEPCEGYLGGDDPNVHLILKAVNSYNPDRDKLARELAEAWLNPAAVNKTPEEMDDIARQLLKLYEQSNEQEDK